MNHIIFRILSRSVVGCSPETIGEMAALNRWRSSSMAVLTLSISSLPAGSVAGDQMSRSANSTAMSRGRVATVWPPLRAANLFRITRRYSVKHHRENKNQDRLSEKDSLKMGVGMHPGAVPGCWQQTELRGEAKNIDLATSISMRRCRAETMRR